MLRFGALKEPDTVRKESEIKGNDKAAIWDNPLLAKGSTDDRIAEEGSIIEDKGKLSFRDERLLPKILIEN